MTELVCRLPREPTQWHITAQGGACSLRGGALSVNRDDESLDENGFDELLRPGTFFRNVIYIKYKNSVHNKNSVHKAMFSLKYTYVNNLFGTTTQSEMFEEMRKPTEVIACLITGFVLNTWILHTSKISLL